MSLELLLNEIMGLSALIMQIFILAIVLGYIYTKKLNKKLPNIVNDGWQFIRENSLLLAFFTVLGGTVISLVYSEIIGYEACKLCWYQRTLIYPQVIILGIALWKKNKNIFDYVIGLNIIGFLIAGYQYYLQRFNVVSEACKFESIKCNSIYLLEFGYITIPFMALTLFIAVPILTYIWKNYHEPGKARIEIED